MLKWILDRFDLSRSHSKIRQQEIEEGSLSLIQDTLYGCCADGQTAAKGIDGEGCPEHIYGCDKYGFGCCPDGVTSAQGPDHEGCPSKTPVALRVGCDQSQFGCCADGVTAAAGLYLYSMHL